MAMRADSMLEYYTRDQEALAGLQSPWFPPLSSSPGPVNLQLMAISEHDFRRSEQTPVTFTLHHVTKNGTRVEYLVRLVAMAIAEDWTQDSELLLNPELVRESDGHVSLDRWTQACWRNYVLVHGHQPKRFFDYHNPRLPASTLRARPEPTFTTTEQGGVWYETPPGNTLDEAEMTFRWVAHCPPVGTKMVVNSWTPNSLVATYFMANGVPVSYNLAIHGAYIQQRHSDEYDTEVRKLLHKWYQDREASLANRMAA